MGNKSALLKFVFFFLLIIAGLVVIIYKWWKDLYMDSINSLAPYLTIVTESPQDMSGIIYMGFGESAFQPCNDYDASLPVRDYQYALVGTTGSNMELIQKMAESEWKILFFGYKVYARFTGQITWSHYWDDRLSGSPKPEDKVEILDLLKLQPLKDQCPH